MVIKMKKFQKIICTVLAVMMGGFVAACGPESNKGTGDATVIQIMNYGGGVGRKWLDEACARFSEANKTISFEEGKTGVEFKIEHNISTGVATMKSAGYNIYIDQGTGSISNLVRQGSLLNINDVVSSEVDGKTIGSKIEDIALKGCKGDDGNYYALPAYTYYPGVNYDRDLFVRQNLFFAAPEETKIVKFTSKLTGKTYNFVKNATAKKSCGIDGKYSDKVDEPGCDDGLPTSVEELIVLCERMKKIGVTPFTYPGGHTHYVGNLLSSMWASLGGYEQTRAWYDYTGEVDVLTGYLNENLFSGIDYIKNPLYEKKTVTEKEGYYASQTIGRYYALSFMEIATREGWFSKASTTGSVTHVDNQTKFVWSDYQGNEAIGMLVEGSYWYSEAVNNLVFQDFYEYNPEVTERRLSIMPMPVLVYGTVAENEGKNYTLWDQADSFIFINSNISAKTGLVKACKEFIKFLCTDSELSHFTGCTGVVKGHYQYSLEDSDYNKMEYYQKSVYNTALGGNAKIIFSAAENETFNGNKSYFRITTGSGIMMPVIDGKTYPTFVDAFRAGKTASQAFEQTRLDADAWSGIYKGE